ncbi:MULTISPECIES: TonB family protein [Thioclava]|uniref:TonB family protein n=1 Tax=Thioclava litoralis TaxID=3076557 RepID=A0ABZ1DXU7_9RHOB|nr:TonB family protein [Thioclava sp. FTW29]
MKSGRVLIELAGFATVAAALHVMAFGFVSRSEGAVSAGSGGDALVSIEAADAQVAELVEAWENPKMPEPELKLAAAPPKIDMPKVTLPTVAEAPPVPEVTEEAEVTPETPPVEEKVVQEEKPTELAPETSERPEAKPEKPVKPHRQARDDQRKGRKSDRDTAGRAARHAAGSGNRGARGNDGHSNAATLSNAQSESLRGRWGAQIRQRVERRKRYPSGANGAKGQAVVRLTVAASGQLVSASLARSSGNAAIDAAALSAVRNAGRFPKAPAGLGNASLTFTLPMSFLRH